MPPLDNARREKYCRLRVTGMKQGDAYDAAGYESESQEAKWANAARLEADSEVKERMDELKEKAAKRAEISRTKIVNMLLDAYESATADKQFSSAVKSAELLGKDIGMFVDRKEIKTTILDEMDMDELIRLRDSLAVGPASETESADRQEDVPAQDRPVLSGDGSAKTD